MQRRTPTIARTLLSLSTTALLGATMSGPAAAHGGGTKTVEVRMDDDCDPATFPAEAGCTGDGDTTFAELVEELLHDGEHGKWINNPDKVTVRQGTPSWRATSGASRARSAACRTTAEAAYSRSTTSSA